MSEKDKYNLNKETEEKILAATREALKPGSAFIEACKGGDAVNRGNDLTPFTERGCGNHEIGAGWNLMRAFARQRENGLHGPVDVNGEMARGVKETSEVYGSVNPKLLAKPPKSEEESKAASPKK